MVALSKWCAVAPLFQENTGLFFGNFPGCECRDVGWVALCDHEIIMPKLGWMVMLGRSMFA